MTKGPGCRDIERLILDREETALGAEDERLIRDHLRVCARCRDFEAARVGMHEAFSASAWPALPGDLDRRTRRRVGQVLAGRDAGAGAREARGPLPRPVLAALGVAIVLIAVWSSMALADIGPEPDLADLPLAARAALLIIAQNAFMLFFAPVILRATRPSGGSLPGANEIGTDMNTRRST